jgi:fructosamine-3-kinase
MTDAAAAVAALTGERVEPTRSSTGSLGTVRLASGRTVVAKRNTEPGMTAAEAASLRWLADSHTVGLPEVLGADDEWLVLERIEQGEPTPAAAEEFGRALAGLHASGATAFGQPPPGGPRDAWIGLAAMVNEPAPSWPEWYADQRISPYLRRATVLDGEAVRLVTEVADRLPEFAGPPEPPARLHGDLWHGNVLWATDGHVRLIDPAAHGGHRETDLAMLALFGCPQLERVLAAYQEVTPLAAGWRERVPLHQLFPLLVHVELFGAGYAGRAVAAAHQVLAT